MGLRKSSIGDRKAVYFTFFTLNSSKILEQGFVRSCLLDTFAVLIFEGL
jgi:hypothetical protein